MQLDLHHAVREAYRQAIAEGHTSREAFDIAADLILSNAPELTRVEACRLAAEMLCWDPGPSIAASPKFRGNGQSTRARQHRG